MRSISVPRLYISAIKKTSGKTTIAIAINRILKDMGFKVQPYKKGPDFIDPMWHSVAAHRSGRNLDFFLMGKSMIKTHFLKTSSDADIAVIEGNHGLFDDINIYGGSDNASLAKLLKAPVILIMDVKEVGRTAVALIKGCMEFDRELQIAGVILNRVQNNRQKKKLMDAINAYLSIPIVGAIPEKENMAILQRHLGLSSTMTQEEKEKRIKEIASTIKPFLDMKSIINIADKAGRVTATVNTEETEKEHLNLRIGVAFDEAFNFYYPENMETLKESGCEIVHFSPLKDGSLPDVDAIYIGGGFPEIFAEELQENSSMRKQLKEFIERGGSVYAECGGLIYLTKSITFKSKTSSMVGAIDATVEFTTKPVGHGYTILEPSETVHWLKNTPAIKAHEFHHAKLTIEKKRCAFNILRGFGVDGECDGVVEKNTIAAFSHQYAPSSQFFTRWLKFTANNRGRWQADQ